MAGMSPETLSQYLDYPIQSPPPGVTPNFVNPDSTAYQVYVSKTFLGGRTVVIDEIVFVVGLVLCLAFIAMTIACVSGGAFGRDAWNVLLGAFTKSQLVILLPLAICFVKTSVLILYFQIFSILKWMRIASIAGIVAITAFHVSLSIAFGAMCAPSTGASQVDFLAAFVSDTCTRTRSIVVLQGVGNVVTDFFLLILPLPAVWALQMPLRRKLAVSAMFLIGISIIGLCYRVQYYTAGENNIRLVVPLWATAMAEETAGVMICCMPSTAAVFKSVKGPVLSWLSSMSERALRLTGQSRSGILLSSSNSNLRRTLEHKTPENTRNPVYCHPGSHDRHTAWVETEVDTYPLPQLNPGQLCIGKKTEVEVSQAI
ncbi:hypothetical protein DL771_000804 [Monosporascus sp. 5C6A]|nr:hypothetical protein DL771_000804 [Monosporascus sp. 5C6A]